MQGAQKLRSEVPEGTQAPQAPHAAQSRSERDRWTFYEAITGFLRGAATPRGTQDKKRAV